MPAAHQERHCGLAVAGRMSARRASPMQHDAMDWDACQERETFPLLMLKLRPCLQLSLRKCRPHPAFSEVGRPVG